ncbi:transketolase [Proteocatella sphenisci]|uniref:transketolase n=1 Tax=Proteocatella sphenisci TaxID=181070 RepID=UPI0004913FC6|nr:transketolase [Proteocatella sphenisci]
MNYKKIDTIAINTIRSLSADAVQKANSGHPGLPLGAAPMAYAIWTKMKHNPKNPKWNDRDRFVLSAGHGSMLVYSLLHLFGYDMSLDDIKNFRQLGSSTPGHPEYGHTEGLETTTGPLGQGLANAVGMAIAESHISKKFNRPEFDIADHFTYVIAGDGCLMEGISSEASSLAGTLELGKLIMLYDSNSISIEGSTDIAFTEDVAGRYRAYGWQVIEVKDGNDLELISSAIDEAKSNKDKPSLIIVTTQIAYGCPAKQGKASAHGEPLGIENVRELKTTLGLDPDLEFYVPEEVYSHMDKWIQRGNEAESSWYNLLESYSKKYPELYKEYLRWHEIDFSKILKDIINLENYKKAVSTREASGNLINSISHIMENFIGGSADLSPSNKTHMKDQGEYSASSRDGRNLHFGVREHAMAAITNGIRLHGGLVPYCGTFLIFSDYMKAAMRLSALMNIPVVYVLTHDSIGVGEDGPTHQPVEQLSSLRSIPNMTVFRPADAKETALGWYHALTSHNSPTSLILSRQNLPLYKESSENALRGAYILKDSEKEIPDIILMASGSEVELIYDAHERLRALGIDSRVLSIPSFEIFERQEAEYKEKVMPLNVRKRIAVEASNSAQWYRYIGLDGELIGMNSFGASGKASDLFPHFGFTSENVVKAAVQMMKK